MDLDIRPKTKIICTLGPSSWSAENLKLLMVNGMSVARLNMSHGSLSEHEAAVKRVRKISSELNIPVGLLVDIPGAKYRTGPLEKKSFDLVTGGKLTLTSREIIGNSEEVSVFPPGIHRDLSPGDSVPVDDGRIELRVLETQNENVKCEVVRGGFLTEKRGVATPGKIPSQPYPDEKALKAFEFAAKTKADFVALSMVSAGAEVINARKILQKHGLNAFIISKIERSESIGKFDEILDASDGIMVARGDMGVEVNVAQIPVIQKDLISRSNLSGKPVITATQMLESMVTSPVPTRAEVTDVANAIYDGTDAIMLSSETSIGDFPVEAVSLMSEVAIEAETHLPYERILIEKREYLERKTDDAISYDACQTAKQLEASLIVAFTESGSTASRVSKYRPITPILALTPSEKTQRKLTLRWGVTPVIVPKMSTVDDLFAIGESKAVEVSGIESGDLAVLVAGLPIGISGGTNLLRVLTLP
jgi:pyruvate kinase